MTRNHAARQLLKLGPLTMREFREIMGGDTRSAANVLVGLARRRVVQRTGAGRVYRYRLAA